SVHFRTLSLGSGAKMALPIWAEFYRQLQADPRFREMLSNSLLDRQARNNLPSFDCDNFRKPFFERLFGGGRKEDKDETNSSKPTRKKWSLFKRK
ncbi:MAG: hypothetical protein KDD36_13220, partial [Flavobacteriales bacterium]|nr:hypothetical protein [Flavobacteriales bacterium]